MIIGLSGHREGKAKVTPNCLYRTGIVTADTYTSISFWDLKKPVVPCFTSK